MSTLIKNAERFETVLPRISITGEMPPAESNPYKRKILASGALEAGTVDLRPPMEEDRESGLLHPSGPLSSILFQILVMS